MALFTTADRDAVKAAMVTAATEGFASVTVGGQTVASKNMAELRELLDMILADLATSIPGGGMRNQQLKPVYP